MKGKRVRFYIDVAGEGWSYVPEDISNEEIIKYLQEFGAMFAGNKIWNISKVRISGITDMDD